MKHPEISKLALLAGGDLSPLSRWRVSRHVCECPQCSSEVEEFRACAERLREAAEFQRGLNWTELAREMKANIRLGLAAGECVGEVPDMERRLGWRPAFALAALTLVMTSAWLFHFPRPEVAPPVIQETTLQATSSGIELQQQTNRALTVLNRAKGENPVLLSVNTDGSVRARYVDSDTGQVTITNVYTE